MNMCRFLEIHLFVAALLQTVFATRSANIELLLTQYQNAYRENQDNAQTYNEALDNACDYANQHGHTIILSSGNASYVGPRDSMMNDLISRINAAGNRVERSKDQVNELLDKLLRAGVSANEILRMRQ